MVALQELWQFVWSWYNLPFTLSLIACLGLSLLQFAGLVDDDADANVDQDLNLDHDADLDAGADVDADPDGDDFPGSELLADFLQLLGAGRAPLTLVALLLTASFGLAGWTLTSIALAITGAAIPFLFVGLWGLALLASVFVTGQLARAFGRAVPALTTTATRRDQLVGRHARVVSPRVDGRYGQVRVRDPGGTLITVFAITTDSSPPITRDTDVVLADFDPQRRLYTVVPLDS